MPRLYSRTFEECWADLDLAIKANDLLWIEEIADEIGRIPKDERPSQTLFFIELAGLMPRWPNTLFGLICERVLKSEETE